MPSMRFVSLMEPSMRRLVGHMVSHRVASQHRLLWIDSQIRAGRHPNASSIAERFEISRRQAARDLEYLRYSLGAPLVYVAARRGYRYADDRYFVPALVLSDDERAALAEIAHRYESAGSRAADMADLFRRIAATPPDDDDAHDESVGTGDRNGRRAGRDDTVAPGASGSDTAAGPPGASPAGGGVGADAGAAARWYGVAAGAAPVTRFPTGLAEASTTHRLRRAIDEHRVVEIVYRDQAGRGTSRRFRPRALSDGDDGLRVSGWCELRGADRALRVAGIMFLRSTRDTFETAEPHDPHRASLTFGTRVGEPYRAVVHFPDGLDHDHVPGARALGDGRVEIEFRASPPLLAALLAGPRFTIERPRWLRERLVAHLRGLLDDHDAPTA
jgi:predicted DNA-binding transcriptional regulator YafY